MSQASDTSWKATGLPASRGPRMRLVVWGGRGRVWAVIFSGLDVQQSGSPSTPSTTNPAGAVITIGGDRPVQSVPGAHNDPADLYGIVLVFLAIAVAIVATRWIFGRGTRKHG